MSPLLRRDPPATPPSADTAPAGPPGAGKKGATPKRSEARAARATERKTTTPTNRKEVAAARRQVQADARIALMSKDPAKLPASERRPELVLTRDLVDGRRNLAGALPWVILAYFILSTVLGRISQGLSLSVFLLSVLWLIGIAVDTFILGRKVERIVLARWPESRVRVRGYAARRAIAPKRWRRPVVRLAPGDDPWAVSG